MTGGKILYHVDSFTVEPFKGNPAGVCFIDQKPSTEWMQNIAAEMNLSETAFIYPENGNKHIRFYTPESEIELCGHATLATGFLMFETGMVNRSEEITFNSKAGILLVKYSDEWITMNFPSYDLERIDVPSVFKELTGVIPEELYRVSYGWTLALLKDEHAVRQIVPNITLLKNSEFGCLIVTSTSIERGYDFCVRCFVPRLGINEDPVTGSAHCALVPFWHSKTGKNDFMSHQISKRTGILKLSLKGNRVEISGRAKTIMKSELYI
jgi:PhzF family phenazine biosynthesis protein